MINFLSNSACLCLWASSSDDEYSRPLGFIVRFVNTSFPVLLPLYFFEIRILVHANLVLRYTRFVVPLSMSANPKPNSWLKKSENCSSSYFTYDNLVPAWYENKNTAHCTFTLTCVHLPLRCFTIFCTRGWVNHSSVCSWFWISLTITSISSRGIPYCDANSWIWSCQLCIMWFEVSIISVWRTVEERMNNIDLQILSTT